MSRLLKYIAYFVLFVVSFVLFFYWSFPYDVLKDRFTGMIEQQVGEGVNVSIKKFRPYWFSGVVMEGLSIEKPGGDRGKVLLSVKNAKARASILSLLVRSPKVSFDVEIGKGEVSGSVRQREDELKLDVEMEDLNLGDLRLVSERTGIGFSSRIDGDVQLAINRRQPVRSTGRISIELKEIKLDASEVEFGDMKMPLPAVVLAGKGSVIKMEMDKGVITVDSLKLVGGDLGIDLKGKVFLSTKTENYRFNLNGSFMTSDTLSQALPFIYMIDKQKREDGSYPLSITGRLARPSVRIGTFTLPL